MPRALGHMLVVPFDCGVHNPHTIKMQTTGLFAKKAKGTLEVGSIELRQLARNDVLINVECCGVCHSDLHYLDNDWKMSHFPLVPGHEVVGTVAAVGANVSKTSTGCRVGVGYSVWSCRECEACKTAREQYCTNMVTTCSGVMPSGEITKGGWAKQMVVPEEFVVRIPEGIPSTLAAPFMCAGVTMFSVLRKLEAKSGTDLLVIGLGGVGHFAVMFGVAMGCEVTAADVHDRSELAKELGAKAFMKLDSSTPKIDDALAETQNIIIDTCPRGRDVEPWLSMLKLDGTLVIAGLPEKSHKIEISPAVLAFRRRKIMGTLTGSVQDIEEGLAFAVKHNIRPVVETCTMEEVSDGIKRLRQGKVNLRLVIVMPK